MKKTISLILVLMLCVSLACTAYATENDEFVSSPSEPAGDCGHDHTNVVGQKDPTCTTDGYTGDHVCDECGEVVIPGEVVPKWGHKYVNGSCEICGVDEDNPQTGDSSFIFLWIIVMLAAATGLVAVTVAYRKKFANQ